MSDEEKSEATLIFVCADCGRRVTVYGYESVHDATESQLAGETRLLFCPKCTKEIGG